MKLTILALTLSVGASGYVHAAQPQLPAQSAAQSLTPSVTQSEPLETISITGARTPLASAFVAGAISIIDDFQIQASGALSLSEILRTAASVNISQSGPMGTLSEIRFRGAESNHVLVMLDGVEINDLGQGGLIDLSHIMLANISRIEILRGPQSALWGSSAVAGVISITSKPINDSSAGSLGFGYGNKQTSQVQGAYANRVDKWRYSVSASRIDTQGENIARAGDEADGYENTSAYARLGYTFSQYSSVKANLRAVDYVSEFDRNDFGTGLIADADNVSNGEQLSFGIDWDYSLKDSIWSQRLSYQFSEQENKNFSNAIFSGSTKGQKQRVVYNHHLKLSKGHLNFGLEAVDETFEQAGPISFGDPNQTQDNSSASFIGDAHVALTQQLSAAASYRYDNNDTFNNADSYRVGLNFQVNRHVRTFLSYAQAVKNPTFTERFGFFPGTFLGNSALTPESSSAFEVGIDGHWQDYQLQVSWYQSDLEDEILGFVFDAESGLFTAQNAVMDSQREGIEIEISRSIQKWQWALTYAYVDATEADAVELRRAPHTGSAWLAYELSQAHQFYLQADYTGSRKDRFFPPFPQPSEILNLDNYWLVSANYRYKHNKSLATSLRISNAFDQSFEDVIGFSGESRRLFLSVNYSW